MINKRHMPIQENKQLSLWSINRYAFINIEMAQLLQPVSETIGSGVSCASRRMLMVALARLLMKKEFEDVSVQEIADEATLNRATFYLHYADKNALLQAMTEARFRNLIERRAITFTECNGALRAIALGGVRLSCGEAQAVPLSCRGWRSKARSFRSLRICSRKDLPIMGWLQVRTRHYPRPPRPGPFLEPRAALVSVSEPCPRRGNGSQD